MTDSAYNRTIIRPLEKPLCDDLNQEFSQADRSLRDTMYALLRGQSGFLGDGFLVQPEGTPSLNVILKAGIGFQDDATSTPSGIGSVLGLNDLSRYKPIVLLNDLTIAVPTPPGSQSRIDLIEVRYDRKTNNLQSRNFLDPTTNAFNPANVAKTLDFNVDGTLAFYAATDVPTTALAYKSGAVSGSPVAPSTDTGYLALAHITVAAGVTQITSAQINLQRNGIGASGFAGRQIFTAGGTYTPTSGVKKVRVRMSGGGGGGGGVAGAATSTGTAGGGASGTYVELTISANSITGGAVAVGAAGAAGAAGDNDGGTGGDSTIVINGTTYTAKGGLGGQGVTAFSLSTGLGGLLQGGSSAGDFNAGSPGGNGFGLNFGGNSGGISGNGGSGPFGYGGLASVNGNGNAAGGRGAGGSGGCDTIATNRSGGAGTAGLVIVDEWY